MRGEPPDWLDAETGSLCSYYIPKTLGLTVLANGCTRQANRALFDIVNTMTNSCHACRARIPTDSLFCQHCGKPVAVSAGTNGNMVVFLLVVGIMIVLTIGSFSQYGTKTESRQVSEAEKRQRLQASIDPPPEVPLTPKQHLEAAKRLLAQIDVNDYPKGDVLIQAITEHATRAQEDSHTKAQADLVMKRMASKALELVKTKAWSSSGAEITAEILCKDVISSSLKAPSTADWSNANSARWSGHPGYFLVSHTVDAQNSFGAKIRANYQCQVVCLSESACEVTKVYPIKR